MSKREVIIQLHCSGRKNTEIIKLLKGAKSTVYHVVDRLKELGTYEDHPTSGKLRTARIKNGIKAVEERVKRGPKRSVRQMAKDINVSTLTLNFPPTKAVFPHGFSFQILQVASDFHGAGHGVKMNTEYSLSLIETRYINDTLVPVGRDEETIQR